MDDLAIISGRIGQMPFRTLFEELDVTMSRTDKIASMNVGNINAGTTESPLLINEAASDAKSMLAFTMRSVRADMCRVYPHLLPGPSSSQDVAEWLLLYPTLLADHRLIKALAHRIRRAVVIAQRVIDRPEDRYYLGSCIGRIDGFECVAALYASEKTPETVVCRVCGTSHDVWTRRAVLLSKLEDTLVTAAEVDGWVLPNGKELNAATIRKWKQRGLLVERDKTYSRPQRSLFRMGDITELALRGPGVTV